MEMMMQEMKYDDGKGNRIRKIRGKRKIRSLSRSAYSRRHIVKWGRLLGGAWAVA